MKKISIFDFSSELGVRYSIFSKHSAEDFYHSVLNKAFKEALETNQKLSVNLDATKGYAPPFIDTVFGNLVYDFGLETVNKSLEIVSLQEPHWLDFIYKNTYNAWESRRINKTPPSITVNHEPWYRLVDNKLSSAIWLKPTEQPAF